jgi:hypothetical protein
MSQQKHEIIVSNFSVSKNNNKVNLIGNTEYFYTIKNIQELSSTFYYFIKNMLTYAIHPLLYDDTPFCNDLSIKQISNSIICVLYKNNNRLYGMLLDIYTKRGIRPLLRNEAFSIVATEMTIKMCKL